MGDPCMYCTQNARVIGGAYVVGIDEDRAKAAGTGRLVYHQGGLSMGWLCPAHVREFFHLDGGEVTINEEGDELEVDGIKFVFES